MAAIYHFSKSISKKIGWHLAAASFFAACAIMTKGPFTLLPVGGAIAGELIIKRNWKELFHWRWLIAGVLIVLFITPELYSLWYQFDSYPEKIVFGKTNVSGIRFFLWDSQFGRFLNTGPMKGKGDPTFFFHTLLWAFLPWSLVMYASLIERIRNGSKKINYKQVEWFTITGSILTLLVFSLSKFQLSYYANIIFPLLAILTAQYILKLHSGVFKIIQNSIAVILLIGGILLQIFYNPATPSLILIVIIAGILFLLIAFPFWLKENKNLTAFYRVGLASILINLYINCFFYPDLLKYQSSDEAAFYINKNYPGTPGVCMNVYAPSFEFYLKDKWIKADSNDLRSQGPALSGIWYVMEEELDIIKRSGTLKFINKKTRSKELRKHFLIKLL
jgi:4-amino-4-deoxy-L-arabinose transferase-like glycosyltransferase